MTTFKCGERVWDFEKAPTKRETFPHLPGLIQYTVPLPLDHMICKTTDYDMLGLDAPVADWSEESQPIGLWAADPANPLGGGGAAIGARNYLLARDAKAGNTEFFDAMVQCKDFVETADAEEMDSRTSNKRPLAGNLCFQAFTHPSGAADGGVVIFSPCKFSEHIKADLHALGGVKGIVVPHAFHTAFVQDYLDEWPDLVFFAGPGLDETTKPGLLERTTGAVVLCDAEGKWGGDVAAAFTAEWQFEIIFNNMGGFPEANMFHQPSGVLCTSDLIYRDSKGETFDWCSPIEDAPEWGWVDKLYMAPNYDPPEEFDPNGGYIAMYRYFSAPFMGGGHKRRRRTRCARGSG